MVVTRFAPSPTGELHVGGARTALYSYLYARHSNGKFILRIEDTDLERSKQEYVDNILRSIDWLGLEYDEIHYQSKRLDIYNDYAKKLMDSGRAYKRVDADKGECIVFKIDRDYIYWDDAVHERIGRDISKDPDLVIVKSDGYPTYNFACVVDDTLMGITHVVRGNDHISNTPKQISLIRALGGACPIYGHIPLILNPDMSKMSKREETSLETATLKYRDEGYLPEALINFLALLGWSPGGDLEIMDKETLIKLFTLERVNKKSAVFDLAKLKWLNGSYIRKKSLDDLTLECRAMLLTRFNKLSVNDAILKELVRQNQERMKTLRDFVDQTKFFFTDDVEYNSEAVKAYILPDQSRQILLEIIDSFNSMNDFSKDSISAILKDITSKKGLKFVQVAQPLRVAATGNTISPPIDETISILGKEKTLQRIKKALSIANK
ncbi:MAG: glutamate--tRNA ligase [Planctomycetes bacterium]|nr:glutamate--tRNA ligase [Planctomycetota bacterium]